MKINTLMHHKSIVVDDTRNPAICINASFSVFSVVSFRPPMTGRAGSGSLAVVELAPANADSICLGKSQDIGQLRANLNLKLLSAGSQARRK